METKGSPRTVPFFLEWTLVLVWALFVFGAYFSDIGRSLPFLATLFDTGGRPAPGPAARMGVWGQSLGILLLSSLTAGCAWALGRRARRWLGVQAENPWIGWGLDYGLGMVLMDLFWMGTGLNALWYKPLWTAGAVAAMAVFLLEVRDVAGSFKGRGRGGWEPPQFHHWPLLLAGVFYGAYSFLQDLSPETFYDSLVYHLAVPRYWLDHHGLADMSSNFFSNYPYGGELFFMNGLAFQGTETAKMLHAVSFTLAAVFLAGWAREIAGSGAGWLALGLALTLPLFTVNTWTTQVEGLLALAVLLFLYCLQRSASGTAPPAGWWLLCGLFAGLALSIKYTAVLFVAGALAVLLFQKGRGLRRIPRGYGVLFLAGLLLFLGPWTIKNLAYTGNPFFPYLMDLFAGRHLPQSGYARLLTEQSSKVTTGPASWFLLPWKLTMDNPNTYNFCGPVWLAFLPALFLRRLRHPALQFLAWLAPLVLAGGLAVTHIFRFIAPDFLLFYLLLSAALALEERKAWEKTVAWSGALSAVLCLASLATIGHYYYPCAGIWFGLETREQYLSEGLGVVSPYYPMAQWTSKNIPTGDRLLIVGDARGLYYGRPFLNQSVFDEQVLFRLARQEKGPEGILRRLKQLGVDDLVVNGLEGVRNEGTYHSYDLSDDQWRRLDDFFQRGTEMAYQGNLQAVYRVKPVLGPGEPAVEVPDLVGFFSGPAIRYLFDAQKGDAEAAGKDLDEVLRIFPHSRFWQGQKSRLQGILKSGRSHST